MKKVGIPEGQADERFRYGDARARTGGERWELIDQGCIRAPG